MKYVWENNDINILSNQDIDCHNCVYKLVSITAFCGKFPDQKPKVVFDGGKCPKKLTKNTEVTNG